jgi:hypothetical protein
MITKHVRSFSYMFKKLYPIVVYTLTCRENMVIELDPTRLNIHFGNKFSYFQRYLFLRKVLGIFNYLRLKYSYVNTIIYTPDRICPF